MDEETLEKLENMVNNGTIGLDEYNAICKLVNSGEISQEEIENAYIPFILGNERHK